MVKLELEPEHCACEKACAVLTMRDVPSVCLFKNGLLVARDLTRWKYYLRGFLKNVIIFGNVLLRPSIQ